MLENFEFIISTKQSGSDRLGCIEGIRAISMTWVVLGHSFLFSSMFMLINNKQYTNAVQGDPTSVVGMAFQAIKEGPYSVDTFFFIGATLVSYLLMKDLDKTNGWANAEGLLHMVLMYVNRILRITLPYAFMILFIMGIPPILIKNPMALVTYTQQQAASCKDNWHWHLLYVNNLVKEANGCIGQSWFLGTDMMLFVVSPLIIYPLWMSKFGRIYKVTAYLWWFLFPVASVAWTLNCFRSYFAWPPVDTNDTCWSETIGNPDFAPWGRRNQCYILGLFLGHILHITKGKKINIPPVVNLIIWQAVFLVLFAIIYAPYDSLLRDYSSGLTPQNQFWRSCSHLIWGLCLCWIIFACCRGHGGLVNDLLSWPGWTPISKVSFMTYLVHMDFNWWFFMAQVTEMLFADKCT
jgi:peptidoglycan/LPS O-acetylase OafA/YrhL